MTCSAVFSPATTACTSAKTVVNVSNSWVGTTEGLSVIVERHDREMKETKWTDLVRDPRVVAVDLEVVALLVFHKQSVRMAGGRHVCTRPQVTSRADR